MNYIFWFLGVFFFASFPTFSNEVNLAPQTIPQYPRVEKIQGRILFFDREGKSREVKEKETFREKTQFKVDPGAKMELWLDSKTQLVLFENTHLNLPAISWEDGLCEFINLEKGEVRLQNHSDTARFFSTPLSSDKVYKGDFIFKYEENQARVGVFVYEGELSFRGLENEVSTLVKAGQQVYFQGVLEEGKPTYDILLKGRRVARGKLTGVESLSADQEKKFSSKEGKVAKPTPTPLPPRTEKQICDKPYGEYKQCVWYCLNNPSKEGNCRLEKSSVRCQRKRCNANGEWADSWIYPSGTGPCLKTKPTVGVCDY